MWDERDMQQLASQLISWRRMFHRWPELSNQERETGKKIAELLKAFGAEVTVFEAHAGVCAVIRGAKPGPVVAFRADMDALPITEEIKVPYCSEQPGVMHACGHDGHMAIALGVAKMFSICREEFAGTVKVIFQPAEEAAPVGGAARMISEGLLDDVDMIFGLHLWPDLPIGQIGVKPGPMMAASDRLSMKVFGQGAHAGQPHNGVDSIVVSANVIQGISQIISRQLDPLETATIAIGTIKGGERYNVVAREVALEGTVRTLNEKIRQEIPTRIKRMLEGVTAAQGATYKLDYQFGYPVLSNWMEPVEFVMEAAQKVIGQSAVLTDVKPELASEDFGRYLEKTPGAFFWLGCAKEGQTPCKLHSPVFDFDEAALAVGCQIMYHTGILALKHGSESQTTEAC